MNKTLKKVLSGIISASMLCSALAIPHTALADDALPTDGLLMDITFDEQALLPAHSMQRSAVPLRNTAV